MKLFLRIIIFVLILVTGNNSIAQSDCKNSLSDADKLFEEGQVQDCINLLKYCLANDHKKHDELLDSYHLLAIAYQSISELDSTAIYIKKMLNLKPDYQKYPNIDPIDFSRMVNEYTVTPKLFLGLKFGINTNSVKLKKSYSAYESPQRYEPTRGWQIGFSSNYVPKPLYSLNADLFASGIAINHIIDNAGGWKQNYREQQNYIILNGSVQKHYKVRNNLLLSAAAGIGLGYLYFSNVFIELTNPITEAKRQGTQNPNEFDSRIRWQPNLNFRLGISKPLSRGILSFETNFSYYLRTTVKPENRMANADFTFNYQYINDDIRLMPMMLNLSYKSPLFWRISLKK